MTSPRQKSSSEKRPCYQITIKGIVHDSWSDWFNGMEIFTHRQTGGALTILRGAVADQAALRGILNRLWDLNATLVAVPLVHLPEKE
jgi:hypothetical protein